MELPNVGTKFASLASPLDRTLAYKAKVPGSSPDPRKKSFNINRKL